MGREVEKGHKKFRIEWAAGLDAGNAGDVESASRHMIAAHALLSAAYALGDDAEIAAHDALYEAMVTTDEISDALEIRIVGTLHNSDRD